MKQLLRSTTVAGILICIGIAPVSAQTATPPPATESVRPAGSQAFTPENAILNTAIPFAVGAREAQQSLRSAFGWPTFQEGLVQGVYFRFDPDGYARFSPSPRLDTDVFEIICRPRTYSCMGRKGPIALAVTSDGRIQMRIDQAQATDTFALNDGFSELQIPPRLNGVLDQQMETLLSAGGTLIMRRGAEVVDEISLSGFSAVLSYLRWVAARQDYSVLPRDWPVPNGTVPQNLQTANTSNWPNTDLRVAPVQTAATSVQPQLQPNTQPMTPSGAAGGTLDQAASTPEVAALRSEVALLRDLLLSQSGVAPATRPTDTRSGIDGTTWPPAGGTSASEEEAMQITQLFGATPSAPHGEQGSLNDPNVILTQLEALRAEMGLAVSGAATEIAAQAAGYPQTVKNTNPIDQIAPEIRHLQYLTKDMGLSPKTALLILQMSQSNQSEEILSTEALLPSSSAAILAELRLGIETDQPEPLQTDLGPETEYQILGTYFRTVINSAHD